MGKENKLACRNCRNWWNCLPSLPTSPAFSSLYHPFLPPPPPPLLSSAPSLLTFSLNFWKFKLIYKIIFLGNHLAVHIKLHFMNYRITYSILISTSHLPLTTCLLSFLSSTFLLLKCQEIAYVKHSFIVQVYWKWKYFQSN